MVVRPPNLDTIRAGTVVALALGDVRPFSLDLCSRGRGDVDGRHGTGRGPPMVEAARSPPPRGALRRHGRRGQARTRGADGQARTRAATRNDERAFARRAHRRDQPPRAERGAQAHRDARAHRTSARSAWDRVASARPCSAAFARPACRPEQPTAKRGRHGERVRAPRARAVERERARSARCAEAGARHEPSTTSTRRPHRAPQRHATAAAAAAAAASYRSRDPAAAPTPLVADQGASAASARSTRARKKPAGCSRR